MAGTQGFTLPAPNGGINKVDGIDALPPNDALDLVNVYPEGQVVKVRKGCRVFSLGALQTGPWRTVAALPLSDGTTEILASYDNQLHHMESGSVSSYGSYTSDDWNTAVYGGRVYLCNGQDDVQVWTGSGAPAASTFTGITLSDLISVTSYKERLYFVEKNSGSCWYGGTKQIGGAALTEYDASYFFRLGGRLLFAGSYTNQLAATSADLFMMVTSEGEVLFYQGEYPGDSTTPWRLVARYEIGRPCGYRSFVRVNNDVWIITEQGIVPVSALFSGGLNVALDSIGRKVNKLIADYAAAIPFSHLWWGEHWAMGRRVFISVPTSGSATILLVCNTQTGAWTRYDYTNISGVLSMCIADGKPYAGTGARGVYELEVGEVDGPHTVGVDEEAITFSMELAPSYFGSRGNFKVFKDVRPLMYGPRGITLSLQIDTDFNRRLTTSTITTGTGTGTAWDEEEWDVAEWASEAEYLFDRYGLKGQGHNGAIRISGSVKDAPLEFNAFEVRFELGGQV